MKIRVAQLEDAKLWDSYVHQHPESSPYHLMGWRSAIEDAYGHSAHYLIAESGNQVCGLFPVIQMKKPWGNKFSCSLPFCDVGFPLADSPEIKTALEQTALSELGGQLNVRDIEECKLEDMSGKVRMLMNLPESSEELLASFKSKLRSQIRKAEKNGLVFQEESSEEGIEAFYTVFSKNMRDLGSPVHSLTWFKQLFLAYQQNMTIGLVYKGELVVGAGILLFAGGKVSIPWASTLREFNKLAPNMLLYWNLLRVSCDRGCSEFDFGRSTYKEGTYKFKSQWGAQPVRLNWRQYKFGQLVSQKSCSEKETPSSKIKDMIKSLFISGWQRMPLKVCQFLGPKLRKYIDL